MFNGNSMTVGSGSLHQEKYSFWSVLPAAAKSLQLLSNSVRPHRQQPTRLPHPWYSPGKNTGVGCYFLLQCMKVKSESEVAQSHPTLATPWTAAYQAPPSVDFPGKSTGVGCHCLLRQFLLPCKITQPEWLKQTLIFSWF